MSQVPSTAGFLAVDTTTAKNITLPRSIDRPGRILTIKDKTGNASTNPITLQTQGADLFEDGTSTYYINQPFQSVTFVSRSGQWLIQNATPKTYFTSTLAGLGTAGYLSTLSLVSTTTGLQNFVGSNISSFSTSIAAAIATGGVTFTMLNSTVIGLGTAGYISTTSLNSTVAALGITLTSTVAGLGTAGYISTTSLNSTVAGLGTAGYISTTAMGRAMSSISSSYSQYFNTISANICSIQTSSIWLGRGDGYLAMPDIRPTSLSTFIVNTSSLAAGNLLLGTVSSPFNAIQFYGLFGNDNNTVLAEVSTGVGTQELLLFKGSSTSDRIRLQTTGSIVFEPGSSSRLWASSITSNLVPAMVIDINSNVGIQTTTTAGIALDVAGLGRFQTLSTQNIQVSTINGQSFGSPINSTVIGLGSAGYVSTSQLVSTTAYLLENAGGASLASTVQGLGSTGYVSTLSLVSTTQGLFGQSGSNFSSFSTAAGYTIQGLGTLGYISTSQLLSTTSGLYTYISSFIDPTELTSTVIGLGTTGYVSSMGLLSTASGLASYITSFIDPVELASTVTGLGSASFVSTLQLTLNITSTVAGLGSASYVSSTQLQSTVASITYGYQTAGFVSSPNLAGHVSTTFLNTTINSTVQGLGSASYVSTSQLQSTVASITYAYQTAGFVSTATIQSTTQGLQYAYQTAGFVSSPNLLNLVSTTALNTSLASTVQGLGSAS